MHVETRTKDNVLVTLKLAIFAKIAQNAAELPNPLPVTDKPLELKDNTQLMERIRRDGPAQMDTNLIYQAYYRLNDPVQQILAHVEQYFRFHGMEYTFDELYSARENMTHNLINDLNEKMNQYGYIIRNILVKDIVPPADVVNAMNNVLASAKERLAQTNRAEADKVTKILAAEAEAKTRELEGAGIAAARARIVEGLQRSVEEFRKAMPETDPQQLLTTVLITQYLDVLKEASLHTNNTFVLTSNPTQVTTVENQLREALLSTNSKAKN